MMDLVNYTKRLPDTKDSGLMYSIAAILFVFASSSLAIPVIPSDTYIILSEVFLIALPPVLLAKLRRFDMASTFRFKKPRAIEVLLTLVMSPVMVIAGAAAGFIALIVIKNTFGSVQLSTGMSSMMNKGVLWSLFMIAFVPSVCEELLFRGFIQRGLEKLGAGWSIFLSGILFGLFHFDFQRFAAQALIGFVAAYVVYRTGSIINGMILHFMNNGLLTLLANLNTPNAPSTGPVPQLVLDPFASPEFSEMADLYGMSVSELLNTMLIIMLIIFIACLVVIFGLLLVIRAITKNRVEKVERQEKAGRGLLLGIPGLILVLTVYTALGLTLINNPVGAEIFRLLGF